MNTTLDYLRGNRKFLITDFMVYGDYTGAEGGLLYTENVPGNKRVVFAHSFISGNEQLVKFADLSDIKSNLLPQELSAPKVIILPRNDVHCFIVGSESSSGFKIAKSDSDKTGFVDLLIIEME
ncbi:MAG: hypothetical protein GY855_03165 [candidate division Zixibacteria bacterium]|nr:hypothetical protein [candidate division Zixibacteria bacterium]